MGILFSSEHLVRVWLMTPSTNHMAQVWNLCSPKAALAKLDGQSSSLQTPKNLSEVSTMLLPVLAENCHIIKVGTGELLAVSEHMGLIIL